MNRRVGLYCSVACFVIWLLVMVVIVSKLPVKLDTIVMLSWPLLPGVAGGLYFYYLDKNCNWDE